MKREKTSKRIVKRSSTNGASIQASKETKITLSDNEPIKDVKDELEKYGLAPVEVVEIVNEINGNRSEITIERDGTPESKLILALSNKSLAREEKDRITSMYLWEAGKHSSSFLMDLFRHKGTHTKETRVFKSEIRFDFEKLVESLSVMYHDLASLIERHIGKRPTDGSEANVSVKAMIEAMWEIAELSTQIGNRMVDERNKIVRNREKEKGWGVYVAKDGQVYSIDDSTVNEVIKSDQMTQK